MKKLFLGVIACAVSVIYTNAQKNTVLVYGDVGATRSKAPNDNVSTGVDFNPGIGYQFTENLTAGIAANIVGRKTEQGASYQKENIFVAGPFLRYTHKLSDIFFIYGQLEGKVGGTKFKQGTGNISSENKLKQATVNLTPAVFINLKKSFGLNVNIGGISYTSTKPDVANAKSTNSFLMLFGSSAYIGISKNF